MRKILVVDDDKDILEMMQCALEDSGYDVETLADGHYLFQKINEQHPDLILLDVMLGGMDGRELCKDVKSKNETHDIPVILVSATHNIAGPYHQNGAPDDFIAKPFDLSVLLNRIQRQLAA